MARLLLYVLGSLLCLSTVYCVFTKTSYGTVKGVTKTLWNGAQVDMFLGIPYADKPIGENRFAPPKPAPKWKILNARTLRDSCPQAISEETKKTKSWASEGNESEDCLNLNIYRPSGEANDKMPVMCWFPPGGFFAGSANQYDGSVLASQQNLIVVTINFRNSVFGYLHTSSSKAPGNVGLMDQIQAIQWVKDNIKNFRGDNERITLFGEGSGATAIGFHLLNPKVRGLFNNAILQSGTMNIDAVSTKENTSLKKTSKYAESMNCSAKDDDTMVECLRNKTVAELLKGQNQACLNNELKFTPVRNGLQVPADPYKEAKLVPEEERKPLIVGSIPAEYGFLAEPILQKAYDNKFTTNESDMDYISQNVLGLKSKGGQATVRYVYRTFDGTYNPNQTRMETARMITDSCFDCPQRMFAKEWVTDDKPVFHYTYDKRPSKALKETAPEWLNAANGDLDCMVFGIPMIPQKGYTDTEGDRSSHIMTFWGNFAKTSDPNGFSGKKPSWPALSSTGPFNSFSLDKVDTVLPYYKERECFFWETVFTEILNS